MKLNINFNKKIESLINSSEALADWFERNQECMAYFELTHPGCLHFENSMASYDIVVLGRMANSCLTWLETRRKIANETKVKNAVLSIAEIYDKEKKRLTETAKVRYHINVDGIEKEDKSKKCK